MQPKMLVRVVQVLQAGRAQLPSQLGPITLDRPFRFNEGIEPAEGKNRLFIFREESGAWKIHRYLFATSEPRR